MFTAYDILVGVAVPAVIALVLALLTAVTDKPNLRRALIVLGIGGGWLVAYALLPGQMSFRRFPPPDAKHWLFYAMAVLMMIAWGAAPVSGRRWARLAVGVLSAAMVMWLVLAPFARNWETGRAVTWIGGTALVAALAWASSEMLTARTSPWSSALIWTILGTGVAFVLSLSASITTGFLAGSLTATFGGVLIASLVHRRVLLDHGPALVAILPLAGLLAINLIYYLELVDALLLMSAPVLAWIATLIRKPGRRWWTQVLPILAAVIPVAIAVGLAVMRYLAEEETPYY